MRALVKIGILSIIGGLLINFTGIMYTYANENKIDNINLSSDAKNRRVEDISYKIANDELQYNEKMYVDKYDKEVLTRENGQSYKIIKVSGTTIGADYHYEGYLAVIYDPSKVGIAKSTGAGVNGNNYGETLDTIAKKSKATVAMNAGGFYDPDWNSNGGIPHGPVIINGKIDSDFRRGVSDGGIIGFNKNNKLVLKKMTAQQAVDEGIRDAIDWGPYLIVDGKNQFAGVKNYTWVCGRAAIGQRKDGIVLMLVVDGLQKHSHGVSYADMASIMAKYGAVNAANLDGGTSTAMVVNNEFINSPWNGFRRTIRWLPNAWVFRE